MKKTGKTILICMLLICSAAAADNLKVRAQVGTKDTIYLGDRFTYQVILDGASTPADVDLTALSEFSPSNYSGRNLSQSSITIINGKKNVEEVKRYIMQYQLSAAKLGRQTIPPVKVTFNGKTYTTNPVNIEVIQPGKTDKMEVFVELSENTCYTGQPITVTISWYIFEDIKNYTISFDGFRSDNFYYEDSPSFTELLGKKATLNISGTEVPAYQKDGLLRGKQALLVKMQKVLIPKSPGSYDLGRVNINADLAVGTVRQTSRERFFDDFFNTDRRRYKRFVIQSEPVTLNVKPLPRQNKPADFYGLVGKYDISATAQATEKTENGIWKIAVGEPVTLKIKIGPSDFLEPVKAPRLNEIKQFADNFKIPPGQSDPEIKGKYKIFTQTIRAENPDITEIPPIPLTYFNSETGKYQTVKSQPIPIKVTAAEKLGVSDFYGNTSNAYSRQLQRIKQGLSANYDTNDALKDRHFTIASALLKPFYLTLWLLPLAGLTLAVIYKLTTSSSQQKQIIKRKKNALPQALKIIKSAKADDSQTIVNAMKLFVGQRFNKPPHSLTPLDCHDIIIDHTGSKELAEEYKEIFQKYEEAYYAPVKTGIQTETEKLINLMREINKKAK